MKREEPVRETGGWTRGGSSADDVGGAEAGRVARASCWNEEEDELKDEAELGSGVIAHAW